MRVDQEMRTQSLERQMHSDNIMSEALSRYSCVPALQNEQADLRRYLGEKNMTRRLLGGSVSSSS